MKIRHEWRQWTAWQQSNYLDAVETAIERGLHRRFVEWHVAVQPYAHDTCAFFIWHRRFIAAYEIMLQSLGPTRFLNLSLPVWNVFPDYERQETRDDGCREYERCAPIVTDLGGRAAGSGPDDHDSRTSAGVLDVGWIHHGPPLQNWYDDQGRRGIVRFDITTERIPPQAAVQTVAQLFASPNYVLYMPESNTSTSLSPEMHLMEVFAFWRRLQLGLHDSVHDTLGGFMRSPASPTDPIFMPLHATVDYLGYLWELCHHQNVYHGDELRGGFQDQCLYTDEVSKEYALDFTLSDGWTMGVNDTGKNVSSPIEQDPLIGKYFSDLKKGTGLFNLLNYGMAADNNNDNDHSEIYRLGYTYDPNTLTELIRILKSNEYLCPTATLLDDPIFSDPPNASVGLNDPGLMVPPFTREIIEEQKEKWISRATEECGNRETMTCSLTRALCLIGAMDYDTLERWALDDDSFVAYILQPSLDVAFHPCDEMPPTSTPSVLFTSTAEASHGQAFFLSQMTLTTVSSLLCWLWFTL